MRSEAAAEERIRDLLDDAVRQLIEDTRHNGGVVRTGPEAARLLRTYPNSGLLASEVTERLVHAALEAGVAVELCRPDGEHLSRV
jgi:hypothetical protein